MRSSYVGKNDNCEGTGAAALFEKGFQCVVIPNGAAFQAERGISRTMTVCAWRSLAPLEKTRGFGMTLEAPEIQAEPVVALALSWGFPPGVIP